MADDLDTVGNIVVVRLRKSLASLRTTLDTPVDADCYVIRDYTVDASQQFSFFRHSGGNSYMRVIRQWHHCGLPRLELSPVRRPRDCISSHLRETGRSNNYLGPL